VAVNKDFIVKNGLRVLANTASSNTTTGALVVDGGAGIAGDLHLGGQIFVDGTVSIQATSNTDTFSIDNLDAIQFDTTSTITAGAGQLTWNADAGTLDLGLNDNVTLQVGQETHVHVKAGEDIADGDVVYASGAVGNSGQIEVSKFIADGTIEERRVIGVATESASSGDFFYVTSFGAIRGVSTDGSTLTTPETWLDGDILYASPNVAGELTKTLPEAPNQAIAIAFVTNAHASNGVLMVRAYDLGLHLEEIHDVHIASLANNHVLAYNETNSRWENTDSPTFWNATVSNNLTVDGNLIISGNTTTVNTNELTIEDLNITLASGAADSVAANNAGITIAGANATFTYDSSIDKFKFNKGLYLPDHTLNTRGLWVASSATTMWGNGPANTAYGVLTWNSGQASIYATSGNVLKLGANSVPGQVVLDTNGNVGVGTDSPAGFLHLYDTDYNRFIIERNNGTSNIATASFNTFGATTTNIEPRLAISVGSTESTTTGTLFVAAGKLGINKTAPVEALDVTGNAVISGGLTATTLNGAFGNTAVKTASAYGTTPTTGNMWFDTLNLKLKVYDGNDWQDAVPSGGSAGANTGTTDANATFRKYTYTLGSSSSVVSGADDFSQTLSYVTDDTQNVEVYVNGVKQVEGASNDYTATTGISVGFTSALSAGDVVDIQVYELLTNDAFYLKTETYTQTETNSQITTALGDYVPAAGGTFTGSVTFESETILDTASLTLDGGYNIQWGGQFSSGYPTIWGHSTDKLLRFAPDGTTSGIRFQVGATDSYLLSKLKMGYAGPAQGVQLDVEYSANSFSTSLGSTTPSGSWTGVHIGYKESTNALYRKTGIAYQRDAGDSAARGKLHFLNNGDFNSTSATIADSKMVVDWNGNVGINSTTPSAKLHIRKGTTAQPGPRGGSNTTAFIENDNVTPGTNYFEMQSPNTATSDILFSSDISGSDYGIIGYYNANNTIRIYTAGTEHIHINGTGDFMPVTTTQDLGSPTQAWQNIYTQDLVLSNESRSEGNSVDGTKGNWTIQEGEDHLYIINNKNGKKYKFALEEIE
jgi:hypothetical protein